MRKIALWRFGWIHLWFCLSRFESWSPNLQEARRQELGRNVADASTRSMTQLRATANHTVAAGFQRLRK
jgi:hypothetical protein